MKLSITQMQLGASPVGAAPTTSSFSTQNLASRYSAKTAVWESLKCWDLVRLISETWQYFFSCTVIELGHSISLCLYIIDNRQNRATSVPKYPFKFTEMWDQSHSNIFNMLNIRYFHQHIWFLQHRIVFYTYDSSNIGLYSICVNFNIIIFNVRSSFLHKLL